MKTVWAYLLRPDDDTSRMPKGAKILSARAYDGNIYLYALVEVAAPEEIRTFRVYGTGWKIPDRNLRFIDTVTISGNARVCNVFEEVA